MHCLKKVLTCAAALVSAATLGAPSVCADAPASASAATRMDDAAAFRPVRKKFLGTFSRWTTLSNVVENLSLFDTVPIDGGVLHLYAPLASGKRAASNMSLRDRTPWPRDVFAAEVPRLKEIGKHPSFNSIFIRCINMPRKRADWRDDAAWATFAGHLRAIAWAAKAGGARGLHIDHEDYFGAKQFRIGKDDGGWEETAAIVRKRGRELFQAVFEEFPEVELFFYRFLVADPAFWNCYSKATEPVAAMKAKGDLWPAFANGILDVMPWTAKVVEGDETGYRYESKYNWFYLARNLQRNGALRLVAQENRDKYRARLSTAFPVYMDVYTDDTYKPSSPYYRGAVEGARAVHLERNLAQAVDAADEYVWLYGERRTWVHWKGMKENSRIKTDFTWMEAFPGLDEVLRANKDPEGFLADCLKHPERYENVEAKHVPWWGKQGYHKGALKSLREGIFDKDGDAFRATGVEKGCFQFVAPAKCGEYYAVTFAVKNCSEDWARAWHGSAVADLNKWLIPGYTVPLSAPDADGWRRGAVLMRVPDFGNSVELTASVHLAEGESAWLKDVRFLKVISLLKDGLPPPPKAGKKPASP